jgi:hypothetical protein
MTSELIATRIDKTVSAQTQLTPTGAMGFSSVEQIMEFAKVMAIAGVAIPKHLRENIGACLSVAIQACEWQMSPFAVANKTYVVNDRIAFEAQLVNAVILKRAPITGRFKISYTGEGQTRKCTVAAKLTDGETVEYESPTLGSIPIKNSPLWKGDPDQQLFYFSSRAMCRRHFPDVLLGIYTPEEAAESIEVNAEVSRIEKPVIKTVQLEAASKPEPVAETKPLPKKLQRVNKPAAETKPATPEAKDNPEPDAVKEWLDVNAADTVKEAKWLAEKTGLNYGQLIDRAMEIDGFTLAQVVGFARSNEWLEADKEITTAEDLPEEMSVSFLENWDTVRAELKPAAQA